MRLVLVLLLMCLSGPVLAQRSLPPEVEQALVRERVPLDALAVVVQEAGSGTTHVSLNAQRPMNPGSVVKLLTTYAALEELGPAFTWKTPVWFGAPLVAGLIDGPLHLQGRGDPKLTLERLWLAMLRLRQMGVSEIRGDIVVDQSAFALPEGSPGDFDNEPLRPYNVRAQALLLNLGAVIYTFTPDPVRGVATVTAEPALDGVTVDATVPLSSEGCGDWRAMLKANLTDPARLRFAGSYPAACGERAWPLAHVEARTYTRALLATLWRASGGKLGGTVREGAAPAGPPLFELVSPALAEVVRDINKFSNNVMARQLFLTLGMESGKHPAGAADADAALRAWLDARGLAVPELVLENGSGLSRRERISAEGLGRVLQAAWRSAVMPELIASLPVTATDGTMRKRLKQNGVAGQAHIKTGSLEGVRSIAGYLLDKGGRRWIVVFFVNHAHAGGAQAAQDALLQWVYERGAG